MCSNDRVKSGAHIYDSVHLLEHIEETIGSCSRLSPPGFVFLVPALKSQDTRGIEAEGDEEDEGEDISSTTGPPLAGGVTEKPNSTSNERSSQILYVITSSPGKPEHSMPGQWAGRGETTGPNASM